MGKISYEDKLRMQTLREQRLGAKAIVKKYPHKRWKLDTVKRICRRIDRNGSAVQRAPGSGRPATARTVENIEKVHELICSQEDETATHRSTREIATQLDISQSSVCRIAKTDLRLKSFRRVPAQVINDSTTQKRLERARALLRRITTRRIKQVFFTDEKKLLFESTSQQPE